MSLDFHFYWTPLKTNGRPRKTPRRSWSKTDKGTKVPVGLYPFTNFSLVNNLLGDRTQLDYKQKCRLFLAKRKFLIFGRIFVFWARYARRKFSFRHFIFAAKFGIRLAVVGLGKRWKKLGEWLVCNEVRHTQCILCSSGEDEGGEGGGWAAATIAKLCYDESRRRRKEGFAAALFRWMKIPKRYFEKLLLLALLCYDKELFFYFTSA